LDAEIADRAARRAHMLVKRARLQGFVVLDYAARYEEAIAQLAHWVRAGALRYREDILDGIEHAPRRDRRTPSQREPRQAGDPAGVGRSSHPAPRRR
jgi:hypothetical protein